MADPQSPSNHQSFDSPAPGAGESPGFWKQTGNELGAAARDPVEAAKGAAKGTLGLPWDVMKLGEIVENKGRDALGWLIGEDIPHYKAPEKPKILEPSNDAQKGGDKATMILGLAGLAKGLAKQGIKVTVKLSKGSDDVAEALGDTTKLTDEATLTHKGDNYEVLTSAEVAGKTRAAHRNSANEKLLENLEADPSFNKNMSDWLGVEDAAAHMKTGKSGLKNPPGTEWHHPIEDPSKMWLLKKQVHKHPDLQQSLHPDNVGGYGTHYKPK